MSDVEQLTKIYLDVTDGADATTEYQQEPRGSWHPTPAATAGIRDTITEMQARYDWQTQLSLDQLVSVVTAFFDGQSDTEIARHLGDTSLDKTVGRARIRLHLFREYDTTADFDLEALRACVAAGQTGAECARRLDIATSTANRYRRIFEAQHEAAQIKNEYAERFEHYCRGADEVPEEASAYVVDDGLSDAIAGAGADNP